jgi:hypothetical protein
MKRIFLYAVTQKFEYYKGIAEKAIDQLDDKQLLWQFNAESNSIATIIKHMHGNMLSRWTDFMTTDGEKEWRNRDLEFENKEHTKAELIALWDEGWACLFEALAEINDDQLSEIIYIRNESHTVMEAIHRQLAHYPYHVGQIVFIAKMLCDNNWQSLSIPKGSSVAFNAAKFSAQKK